MPAAPDCWRVASCVALGCTVDIEIQAVPISSHLSQKLHQALGQEAAEDLVSWIEHVDDHRGDIGELRHDMQLGFTRLEAKVETEVGRAKADLMKWSFVFWVGAVAAIAALAGVLT
jgi:hypothetical protein